MLFIDFIEILFSIKRLITPSENGKMLLVQKSKRNKKTEIV